MAYIKDVVFRNLVAGEHKGQTVAEILDVALVERKPALVQRRLGRKHHVFDTVALVVKQHIENFVVLAGDGAAVQRLYGDILPVSVLIASSFEFLLLGREALDDFLGRDAIQRRVLEGTLLRDGGQGHEPIGNSQQQDDAERPFHVSILSDNGKKVRARRGGPDIRLPTQEKVAESPPLPHPSRSARPDQGARRFWR